METTIYIALGIFILLIVSIAFAWRYYKYRKKISELRERIPGEILDIFNKAENKMKGGIDKDGKRTSPYKILWELARDNPRRTKEPTREERETRRDAISIPSGELHEQLDARQSIQNGDAQSIVSNCESTSNSKRERIKSFIRRKRK